MDDELEKLRARFAQALGELELNAATSVDAMLGMLRARDPRASDHARRVARLAVDLAMTLQIGEPQLSDIERAALLHHVRLVVPGELLARIPFLAGANEIAAAAEERYDGTGFPHGLRGDAIPLGARIIGVANAFDELVSAADRARTPAQAIDELVTRRAAQFDPMVLGSLEVLHPSP